MKPNRAGGRSSPPARYGLPATHLPPTKPHPGPRRLQRNRAGTLAANSLRSHRLRGEQRSRRRSGPRPRPGGLRRSCSPAPSPTRHMSPASTRAGRNRGHAARVPASLRSGGNLELRVPDPASDLAGLARRNTCTDDLAASAPRLLAPAPIVAGDHGRPRRQRAARRPDRTGEHARRPGARRGALGEVARLRPPRRRARRGRRTVHRRATSPALPRPPPPMAPTAGALEDSGPDRGCPALKWIGDAPSPPRASPARLRPLR